MPKYQYTDTDVPGPGQERVNLRKKQRQTRTKARTLQIFEPSDYKAKSEYLSTEDDVDYFHMDIRSVSDPQYLLDAVLKAIEYGHKIGHWDEIVAAQQTAYDTYCQNLFEFIASLMPHYVINDFMKSFPEDVTNALTIADGQTTNVKVPYFKKSTRDNYVTDLKNAGVFVPDWMTAYFKAINFAVKFNIEWFKGLITIPAQYYYPYAPEFSKTEQDTSYAAIIADIAKAEKFSNYFGLNNSLFDESIFEYETKTELDDDLIAWFGHQLFLIYDGANPQYIQPTASWSVADKSTHKYWFKHGGSPNDSDLHALAYSLLPNHANNTYGGAFKMQTGTTQGYPSIFRCDESEDTELVTGSTLGTGLINHFLLYDAIYRQTDTLNISLTGTYLAADNDISQNIVMAHKNCKYYDGLSDANVDNALVFWLKNHMSFGIADKKSSPK